MIHTNLLKPPGEFSLIPFWFWNDALDEDEIIRQIDDFQQHGVDGFVIHPRVGLPRDLGWMSEHLLGYYQVAIEAAKHRDMSVLLYDEGMYPSGSSSGQVVATNPAFSCRCLAKVDMVNEQTPPLKTVENLVAIVQRLNGSCIAVIDRPANSVIRGLHYLGEGPKEEEPPAADILNPQAVATFIHLVYDKFASHFSNYFGSTILGIFTDEPGLLGRSRERGILPGTTGILDHIKRILGYDIMPHLAALWYSDEPDAARYQRDFAHALSLRLEETYYQPLSTWCEEHGIALTGHPGKGDDIGPLRYFHIPGQDLVWRWVLPDQTSALEGPESTQAKCSSSAMNHNKRQRNANEFCGAYGHEMTWEEMNWLARWACVRGVNLLIPHAFYYSVRGVRLNERPPDVGPHSRWWDRFPKFALESRRLSWINTDSQHICHLAILGQSDYLPWQAAKICYRHQVDFNYLEERDLLEKAKINDQGIHIAGMFYHALILEYKPSPAILTSLESLINLGKVCHYTEEMLDDNLIKWLSTHLPVDLTPTPSTTALRVRHVVKEQQHYYLLFNEEKTPIAFSVALPVKGIKRLVDPITGQEESLPDGKLILLDGYELKVLIVT
jgi:hypothetical protein